MSAQAVLDEIYALKNPSQASNLSWFFKTGPGEYGEGDLFLGLKVPQTREVAKRHRTLELDEIQQLLESDFHEVRQCGLFILNHRFEKAKSRPEQKAIFDFYMQAMRDGHINNWDLVDATAGRIGAYLVDEPNGIQLLRELAIHPDLWHRRLSIIFTFAHIARGQLMPTLEISEMLLSDSEDLIHKAVGWTLREVGKRDIELLRKFLKEHGKHMPRTALRYAIEKMTPQERQMWLATTK